jgi:hypothetical protein
MSARTAVTVFDPKRLDRESLEQIFLRLEFDAACRID